MALSHLRPARRILVEAEHHHEDGAWNLVVRRSQESVELALKAVLAEGLLAMPEQLARLRQETEGRFETLAAALASLTAQGDALSGRSS